MEELRRSQGSFLRAIRIVLLLPADPHAGDRFKPFRRMMYFLFSLEVITGVMLSFYYDPAPEAAYGSIQSIMRDVSSGWLIRGLHSWGTGALVGGVVGYLLGMRTRVVFASVFAGHLLSVVSLIWFFDWVKGIARAVHHGPVRYAPWIVLGGLLVAAFLGRLAVRVVRRGRGSG